MFLICMVSQGICPGNRLRLLAGVYDTGQLLTDSPELLELNTLQRQGKRRSWHVQPNKVSFTLRKMSSCFLAEMLYIISGKECTYLAHTYNAVYPSPTLQGRVRAVEVKLRPFFTSALY
jgi:hypothetical protein